MSNTQRSGVKVIRSPVQSIIITADLESILCVAPCAGSLRGVLYTPRAAITGAASTASRTVSVMNRTTGLGAVVMATLPEVVGINFAQYVPRVIPLSAVAGATTFAEGDVLTWLSIAVTVAVGLVDPGGTVELIVQPFLT